MTQEHVWENPETRVSRSLLQWASEIPADAEAIRRRLAQTRRRLLAERVLLSPDDPPEAWIRKESTAPGPPPSYPKGVSPIDGALNQ